MPFSAAMRARQAELAEVIDGPCPSAECARCLHDLERVNRMLFAYRPTLRWLTPLLQSAAQPLKVVDVACGSGDMLRQIDKLARRLHVDVSMVGIDSNPDAIQQAQQQSSPVSNVKWICDDVFACQQLRQVDIVVSSLFTHHLQDEAIVRFLAWMEITARRGWLVNDLERSTTSYFGFKALASAMRWHPYVRHDGPVSILRSFTRGDWQRYLQQAGVSGKGLAMFHSFPGRLCVSRVKE